MSEMEPDTCRYKYQAGQWLRIDQNIVTPGCSCPLTIPTPPPGPTHPDEIVVGAVCDPFLVAPDLTPEMLAQSSTEGAAVHPALAEYLKARINEALEKS